MQTARHRFRAQWHDYNGGVFFITVVTKDRVNYFGDIHSGEIILSHIGRTLDKAIEYAKTAHKGIDIPHYVIMPNHFHAIFYIADNVGTQHVASAHNEEIEQSHGALKPKKHPDNDDIDVDYHYNSRLAVAIRNIKAAVTREAKQNGCCFAWQRRFHDRIIRNQKELNLISEYIDNNVLRWDTDCFKD